MALLFRTDYDVEITDDTYSWRDIYRLENLPAPLRHALGRRPRYATFRWRSPDGCVWLVRPVLG
jgi:hypothetical protein